jgi:prophage antirepressor-like protein
VNAINPTSNVPAVFTFDCGEVHQQVRTVLLEGVVWFVASDVCRSLGWPVDTAHGGTTQHLRGLSSDEKRTVRRSEGLQVTLFATTHASAITLISESGLYKLIMRSDKPQARIRTWGGGVGWHRGVVGFRSTHASH